MGTVVVAVCAAWAGALATYAHNQRPRGIGATVDLGHGALDSSDPQANYKRLMLSDDPRIWRPFNY